MPNMKKTAVVFLFPGLFFPWAAGTATAQEWTWSGSGAWNPPSSYFNAFPTELVPMDAVVTESPPSITLRFFRAGEYRIYRKGPFDTTWGAHRATVTVSSAPTTWTDTGVVAGELYEYGVGEAGARGTRPNYYGNVLAGIRVDRTLPYGRFAIVVAQDIVERLPAEYARYKADLVEEGWTVHEIVVPRAPNYTSNGTGPNDANGVPTAPFPDAHIQIRNQLIALYQQYPGALKNVVLLGKVPVARSGIGYYGPDGHGNRMAAGADAYYADMDGVWTDTGNNLSYYPAGTERNNAVSDGRINVAGDNKFDPTFMSQVGGNQRLELGFGRVDFSNLVPGEYEAMRNYFNKLHRFKRAAPDFRPGRRAIYRMAATTGPSVENVMWRGAPGIVGMERIALIRNNELTGLPLNDPAEDSDSAYSRLRGPFLFYFKGSGGPELSHGGQAVFWTGLQSHWGYWYMPNAPTVGYNLMQKRIAEDNFTLSYTWSIALFGGGQAQYLYHRMGMGFDAGDMMRVSMSQRFTSGAQTPIYDYSNGPLSMNHMGCPSLRAFQFPGPSRLSIATAGGHPALAWEPSPDPEALGYHVYRASAADGPYTRITAAPVAGTAFTDTGVSAGAHHYLVRAVRLETTGGGTFFNASLGVRASINLDAAPPPITVATTTLATARWNMPYRAQLSANGGYAGHTWSLVAGALPPGLALSPAGVVSGAPTAAGEFAFTVRAADGAGAAGEGDVQLTVLPYDAQTFHPVAGRSLRLGNGALDTPGDGAYNVSGPVYNWTAYLRFDLSGLQPRRGIRRATLRLTLDERIPAANINLLLAGLSQPTADWQDSTIAEATAPADDPDAAPATPVGWAFPAAFGTLEFDVTDLVRRGLDLDPEKRVGFRLHNSRAVGFGEQTRIVTRHATAAARPTLIVETSDAPSIVFRRPSVRPAAIVAGSRLILSALVTPAPEREADLTMQWSQVSGPAAVQWGPVDRPDTWASFPSPGHYTLRLRADDGVLWATEDLEVRVLPEALAPVYGPSDGLLVRLAFDETAGTAAADTSGASPATPGVLATIGGTGLPQWQPTGGRFRGALAFDGEGQRVEIADSAEKPLDGFAQLTVSAWMRLDSANAVSRALVAKRGTTSASTISWQLGLNSSRRLTANIGSAAVTGPTTLAAGQWHHVAMVFDGTLDDRRLKLFVNGLPEIFGTVSATQLTRAATVPVRVGDYTAAALSSSFLGLLDEVRIYNRALTQAEILLLASSAAPTVGPRVQVSPASVAGMVGEPVSLEAQTEDGGFGPVSLEWSRRSGPGSVVFSAPFAAQTEVTANAAGMHVLRVVADNGAIATWADVTADIAPRSLSGWRLRHFGTANNEGPAADDANPAGDGLSNLLKYTLGLNPHTDYRGTPLHPMEHTGIERIGGHDYVVITLTRDTRVSDAALAILVTRDLVAGPWTALDPLDPNLRVRVQPNTPSEGIETITIRDATPFDAANPRRFLRLRAQTTP